MMTSSNGNLFRVTGAGDLTGITLDNNHTAYRHICLQGALCVCVCQKLPARNNATIVINVCNHRHCWNQNGATIAKAKFFFCHYYIVWESNNAGEARGQSWSESLKSRWIPGGSCGYTSGTKPKHFAALFSPRPCWRWLQLQPSCGSPQCRWSTKCVNTLRSRRNKRHFADEIFKCIFWNENVWPSVPISLKFLPNIRINNIPSLVQIMAWRRPGDKLFS